MTTVKRNTQPLADGDSTATAMLTASKEVVVTDSTGRRITLKKPGLLAQFQLVEAVGPEAADNSRYMSMAMPLIYVLSIDGLPVPIPRKRNEVDALIQRLEEHGFAAVAKGLEEHFADKQSAEKLKDEVKE